MSPIKTVLLVDDDVEDQEIFEVVVNELEKSINCICCETAEDALHTLLRSTKPTPDYIFLDLNLPFMTGFECLEVLKNHQSLQNIPVIIYSTSSRETDKQKAKALGAINYISKPGSFLELKSALKDVIN